MTEHLEQRRLLTAGLDGHVATFGDSGEDQANAVTVDDAGNSYVVGTINLTSRGTETPPRFSRLGESDLFVSSYTSSGELRWRHVLGGNGEDLATGVALGPNGHVFLTGNFQDTVDFDPERNADGRGVRQAADTDQSGFDFFVLELTGDGEFVDVSTFGQSSFKYDYATDIAVDADGGIYLTGWFGGTIDFDPSANATEFRNDRGNQDIFLLRLNSTRELDWVRQIGSGRNTGFTDYGTDIEVDADGSVYLAGRVFDTVDFDSDIVRADGSDTIEALTAGDAFVASYSRDGSFRWVRRVGRAADSQGTSEVNEIIHGLTVTPQGTVAAVGEFTGGPFDPGKGEAVHFTTGGGSDIFITEFNADDGTWVWSRAIGSSGDDRGRGIASDAQGALYVTGFFNLMVDFAAPDGSIRRISNGADTNAGDGFLVKFNAQHEFESVNTFGSSLGDDVFDVAVDSTGRAHLVGYIQGTATFETDTNTSRVTSAGLRDAFLFVVPPIVAPAVSISPGSGLVVSEDGTTADVAVQLTTRPELPVEIRLNVTESDQAALSNTVLVFTPDDWDRPQSVTISAVNDDIADGDLDVAITVTVETDDLQFRSVVVDDLSVRLLDNDRVGLVISPEDRTLNLVEDVSSVPATRDTMTIALESQPTSSVTVRLTPDEQQTVTPDVLIFTPENWDTPQTVTVRVVEDKDDEADTHLGAIGISLESDDSQFDALDPTPLRVEIQDNDTASILTRPDIFDATTEAGGTSFFRVKLLARPKLDVAIRYTLDTQGESEIELSSSELIFTRENFDRFQRITLTGLDDDIDDGDVTVRIVTTVITDDPQFAGLDLFDIDIVNLDDDTAGVIVETSGDGLEVEEGGASDAISVRLQSQPESEVSVFIDDDDQVIASARELIFTPGNWDVLQTVTISAVDDATPEGDHLGRLTFRIASADPEFDSLEISPVDVSVSDNDPFTIRFVADYADDPDEGFFDADLGAVRRSAFDFAMETLSDYFLAAYEGETVTIEAFMNPLQGDATSAVLGSASPTSFFTNLAGGLEQTVYGQALAQHVTGTNIDFAPDITATFNESVDNDFVLGLSDWHYETDAEPGADIDFVTVAIHEIVHGLNFFDLLNTDGTSATRLPGIWDRFLELGDGTDILDLTRVERAQALVSDDLFWGGVEGTRRNDGIRPRIFAPREFQPGSSISHLDQATFPGNLMSPSYSTANHELTPLELGMLNDMGWSVDFADGTTASSVTVPQALGELAFVAGSSSSGFVVQRSTDNAQPELNGRVLEITGSQADDKVTVSANDSTIVVDLNGTTSKFESSDVDRIQFSGGAGDDWFKNETDIPVDADGEAGNDSLLGGRGDDALHGGDGDDVVFAGNGRDSVSGDDGNDRLFGGNGFDTIDGGLGDDFVRGGRGADRLFGNDGEDEVLGDQGSDMLNGGDGHDSLTAGDGADLVFAGLGNDVVDGGTGDDRLFGDAGVDTMTGSTGRDFIRGGMDGDELDGGSGFDTLHGDQGNDTITGGDGNDTVYGGNGRDSVFGGAGNDRLFGNNGYDTVVGGLGDDFVRGGRGRDALVGDDGNDILIGDEHDDMLIGGTGSDRLDGGAGDDSIDVQEVPVTNDVDTVVGSDMADTIFMDPADLLI